MIVQIFIVVLILGIATICDGTSYSNVYVERDIVPIGYYTYGAPFPSIENPRPSEINSLPSVHGHVTPCVSPCVYPAQTVATVAPVTPIPNVLTYNAKHVPVAVAPTKQESTGYEYSYVVYDEHTGDHKAQRELSDGSVVRGEYSFLQPDGYVREVQYVADDISGFNAVVKNFLPAPVETKKKVDEHEKKESPPPCHETKNEALKETSEEDSGEITIKQLKKIHEILHTKHSNDESAENSEEEPHSKPNESGKEKNSKDKHHKETKKKSEESEEESREESDSEESKEELKEKSHASKKTDGSKEKHKSKKGSKETFSEDSEESEEKVSHGKHQEVHELLKPTDETLVPYKDILRCLETAMRRNYGVPVAMRQGPSPLTYIVLNKPC